MTKNSKNNYSVIGIFMMLCLALVFSCTNVTNTSVIAHGKKTLAQPTFDTEGGAVDYGTIVKFSYTPNDAQLYYTLDGSEPDIEDKDTLLYDPSNGIEITESCIIKARLYHSNYYPSTVAENMFNVTLAKPKFSPNGGNITTNDKVTLSHDLKGVDIYYTIDGTTPTDDMEEYAEPFCINKTGSVTVKAIAMKDGLKSKIAEQVFNVRNADGVYLNDLTVNSSDGTNYLTNFNPLTNDYDISVPNSVDSVTVYGSGTNASVERGNGQYTLNAGEVTKVTVVLVSTTDSSKTNEYTVKITRAREGASDDATLSVLELQGNGLVTLTPSFSSDMKEYTATVDNAVSSVIVNFSTNHFAAKADYKSGDSFSLVEGENTLKIQVTAEDGETKLLYTVKITRGSQINNNAELKSVTVNGKSVSVSSNMSYTVSESDVRDVRVVATPEDPAAKVKINGDAVTATNVNVPSTVNIEVTAEDGKTVKKYILDLKAGVVPLPTPNCLAELKTVTVNGEDVTVGSAMTYTTSSKPDADIVITAEGATSTTINSVAGTSTSVKISDDGKTANKVVSIVLTDENGNQVTYTLALTYKALITDKIVLHAYGYTTLWAWDDSKNYTGGNWPGTAMKEEGNKWYGYTLNVTKCGIIFSNGGEGKTVDLSQTAGEWWYKDGKWYEYNPEDSVLPVLTAFTCDATGTASGEVTFTVSATDNISLAKLVAVLDGSTKVAEVDISGVAYNGTFTWNSAAAANGSHTIVAAVEDASGNVSNEMTVNITTQNENAKPEAVITGGTRVKKGSTVTYNALRSTDLNGTVEGYSWRVSGATILKGANEASCEIQFPGTEGKATIYLTVTDNEHADSAEVSHEVDIVDQVSNDFREESIYFLMTTRFYDGDPDNNEYCWDEGGEYLAFGDGDCAWRGDFKGIAEKLDYIKALGFSAIWITPVVENASGIDYHGYHAYDFSRVDPRYESTDFTYQNLIDACHAKGIKVIQDIVLNHTGNFGERNLFHMFDKETTPYINKDVPTPAGGKRSPFMKVAKNGNAYQHLMKGLKQAGGSDYDTAIGGIQYGARINAMKEDSIDTDFIYHHAKMIDWNSENCQLGQMAGDCVDLNTENPTVYNYLIDCYNNYINMGVDGF
ncbi:MAG: chitobiase/beta-hexosaminidase C-terminal domain-containing protein, partial [Spirochaetales bacterium]|nr:chitobiase/beta-hexosaminidase C-terminal domain-containing protein [Spirochaetales bacterium]